VRARLVVVCNVAAACQAFVVFCPCAARATSSLQENAALSCCAAAVQGTVAPGKGQRASEYNEVRAHGHGHGCVRAHACVCVCVSVCLSCRSLARKPQLTCAWCPRCSPHAVHALLLLLLPQVAHTYFPLRGGNKVTLYHDSTCVPGPVDGIKLAGGGLYSESSCWDDVYAAIMGAQK
jgi:hypothetical protein